MALREPIYLTGTGVEDTLGPIDVPFVQGQEIITVDGRKLCRSMGGVDRDYDVIASNPLNVNDYDTILLNTPLAVDEVLELLIYDEDVAVKSIESKLDDVLTALIGSWIWDKKSNIMTMVDTSGDEQFKFEVKDSADWASQERRQDMED